MEMLEFLFWGWLIAAVVIGMCAVIAGPGPH